MSAYALPWSRGDEYFLTAHADDGVQWFINRANIGERVAYLLCRRTGSGTEIVDTRTGIAAEDSGERLRAVDQLKLRAEGVV